MPDLPQEQAGAAISDRPSITRIIADDGGALSSELNALRRTLFPPASHKLLRSFSSGEAAKLIGVADGYLRQLSLASKGPQPEIGPGGRRSYTLGQLNGSIISLSAGVNPASLAAFTKRVAAANGWDRAPRVRATYPPFEHVIYVIKENRTYDQVLGDLATFFLVGRQQFGFAKAANGKVELPRQVERVVHRGIHALSGFR